jgi:DNA-binding transcriptional regulator YiaG
LTPSLTAAILPLAMSPSELKSIRAGLRMTQAELAEALGVTWNTVARWETGQRRIPELAVKLLACLDKERSRGRRKR